MTPTRRQFLRATTASAAAALANPAFAQTSYLQGIDISHWQGNVNWTSIYNSGVRFAFVKATEGTTFVDSKFAQNWAAMKVHNIVRGAYHFGRPNTDPIAQARFFIRTVRPTSGDLPLCLDIEVTDGQTPIVIRNWIQRFCAEIRNQTGKPAVIYTGFFFWRDNAGNSPNNYNCPLWMARWNVPSPFPLPQAWTDWTFWQYSATGTVPGVSGNCDLDYFNGTTVGQLQQYVLN